MRQTYRFIFAASILLISCSEEPPNWQIQELQLGISTIPNAKSIEILKNKTLENPIQFPKDSALVLSRVIHIKAKDTTLYLLTGSGLITPDKRYIPIDFLSALDLPRKCSYEQSNTRQQLEQWYNRLKRQDVRAEFSPNIPYNQAISWQGIYLNYINSEFDDFVDKNNLNLQQLEMFLKVVALKQNISYKYPDVVYFP